METSIQLLNEAGSTILFSSHYMSDVERMAGRILMLEEGRILIDQALDALRENYALALLESGDEALVERLRSLQPCICVRRRNGGTRAVFRLGPDECRALLTGALVAARTEPGRDLLREAARPATAALQWGAIAVQLLLPAARTRAGELALTLPVSGRRLWLTSLLASLLSTNAVAAVMILVMAGGDRLLGYRLGGAVFAPGALPSLAMQTCAAVLLAAALLELPRPGHRRWPLRGWLALYGAGAAIMPGVLLIVLRNRPLEFALACLACAAACLFRGLRRQPDALLLEVSSPSPAESSASWMPAWTWLSALRWTIGLPTLSAAAATVMVFGTLQGILKSAIGEEDETGLLMAPMLGWPATDLELAWMLSGRRP
ncbi:MAG: hypothetical protein HY822_02965 [Acidobacteria bacterium]|nr:hypothetical protein [Acidobacteriota bacterium]